MTKNQTQKNTNSKIKLEDVKVFLEKNPKIFKEKPELFELISPPSRSKNNLIDIQQYMIESLQKKNIELREKNSELILVVNENQKSQEKINSIVLEILKTKSLEEFINLLLYKSQKLLNLDYVNIIIEETKNKKKFQIDKKINFTDRKRLKPFIIEKEFIFLSKTSRKNEFFFIGTPEKILSSAIIRLNIFDKSPTTFLVLGSKNSDHFDEGQGTELLDFLRECINSYFKLWLNL